MPPVSNKRHLLIISNLKSIMAEIRNKSLIQLSELPDSLVSHEDKVGHYREAMKDAEEAVRSTAKRLLQETGASSVSGANPSPTAFETRNPPSEQSTASPAIPFSPSVDTSFATPQGDTEPEIGFNDQGGSRPQQVFQIEAPPLEEAVDPALPALKSLKAIPQKLEHIRFLARNRPGGHLTHLLLLAQDEIEEVALTALQTLLNLRDPRVPPQVLVFFSVPGFTSQRRFLVLKIIMETITSLEAAALEHILLTEKDVIVKSGLVKVFARLAKDEGIRTLKLCLFDADPRVRANTVEVIEEQGIHGCEAEITQLLQDPENRVKVNAAKFLVKSGYTQAFQTLKTMLGSSEVWLRDSVIFALGEIGDQASLTLLKAALKDPNQGIRLSVLKSLAKINNNPSRDALQGSIDDPDPVVAQVARGLWEKIKILAARPPAPPPQPPPPLPEMPTQQTAPVAPVVNPPIKQPAAATITPPVHVAAHQPPAVPARPVEGISLPPLLPDEPVKRPAEAALPRPEAKPAVTLPPASFRPAVPPPPASESSQFPKQPLPSAPILPPKPPAQPQVAVVLPAGSPKFQKPRSAEVYLRLINGTPTDLEAAMKDLPFILGDDQMVLLEVAAKHSNENVRLNASKILSRKKGPQVVVLLQALAEDSNSLVSSVASKALTLIK